ncbi:MAG: DUF5317 domain-containing protein [Chloroflexi bacterium]|nr:DUF5317 domain-containing protein [Chloroflexota bacterium]
MALLLQLAVYLGLKTGVTPAGVGLLLFVSYALLLIGTVRNLRMWGFRLFLIGLALNMAAMGANGWRMPVSPATLLQAGFVEEAFLQSGSYLSSVKSVLLAPEYTRLGFLTDIIVITKPLRRIFSVGDIMVLLGVVTVFVEWCLTLRSRRVA